MTGAAFFDFDNTIIKGDVGPLFGQHIFNEAKRHGTRKKSQLYARYIPHIAWLGVQSALYNARALRRSQLVRSAYKMLRGIDVDDYYPEMDAFVADTVPGLIYDEVRQEIEQHLAAGRRVVIITTGVEQLVKKCLPFLPEGIEVIGCRLREKNGMLTGEVDGPLFGADKANIMDAYCRAGGFSLDDCWAYTDHYSDYQMLDVVKNGVCINPRKRLTALAKHKNWRIMEPSCD